MRLVKDIFNQFHRHFFNSVVKNRLIYNSCWEDPRIDRQLLNLDTHSNVVMLTSAGCNALDYLLDDPASIHCVDTNPAQNAVLQLKKTLFVNTGYDMLWNMFGNGQYRYAKERYHEELRTRLSIEAQHFWDHHINYFLPSASTPSFYYSGTSGAIATIIHKRIKRKGLYSYTKKLLDASSLEEQQYYFEEIEPYLWNAISRWLLKRNATMAMLGVPPAQRAMIDEEVSGGLPEFIHQSLLNVFTKRPITDNYFWRVYLTGCYTPDCCPNYLKQNHFEHIQKNISRINYNTESLTDFLNHNPGRYSHFVLLDHQDWMAHHQPEKLAEEWRLILANARPGAKILFRSAGTSHSFVPDFVNHHLEFEDKKTERLHSKDRVGTYGSTHLAIVQSLL